MIKKIFLMLLLATVASSEVLSQTVTNYIEVIGTASVKVKPDIANFSIVISESDASVRSIGVEKAEKNLFGVLKKMNLDPDKNLTLNNAYSDIKNRRNGVISKKFTFRLTDVTKVSQLIENLEAERIMNISLTNFEVSNSLEIKQKLRALAVKDGKEKAKVLAEAANAKVGSIMSIIDSERDYNYPVMVRSNTAFGSESGGVTDSPINFELSDIQFRSNVTTTWRIDHSK